MSDIWPTKSAFPRPPNVRGTFMDVQASSAKTWLTSTRFKSEQALISDWWFKTLGNGYSTQRQYLEPCGFHPAPQVPMIGALHLVKSAMESKFGEGYSLCHILPVLMPM